MALRDQQWSGKLYPGCDSSWLSASSMMLLLLEACREPIWCLLPMAALREASGSVSAQDLLCPFWSLLSTHSDLNLNQLKLTLGKDSLQVLRAHMATTLDRGDRECPHHHRKLQVSAGDTVAGLEPIPLWLGSVALGTAVLDPPCYSWPRQPRPLGEPQPLRKHLSSAPQLVNWLGSKRGGAELFMQSPALQARQQHRKEQLAAVEGECHHCQSSPGLDQAG